MSASIAEQLAAGVERARKDGPGVFRETAERLLIDVAGLCVAVRNTDYVRAAIGGWEASGRCTAIGHARTLDAAGAAFVNGTAARTSRCRARTSRRNSASTARTADGTPRRRSLS